jgi:hypothetical protein
MTGKIGAVRSMAWIWLFSSTARTSALVGGLRYRPTMSRTLSTNSESVDSFQVCTRCGFQSKRPPDPRDRRLRHPRRCRHRPRRPVGVPPRRLFQGLGDNPLDLLVTNDAWPTRTRLIGQSIQPVHHKPRSPLRHCRPGHPQLAGHLADRGAVGALQHNPRPQRQRLRRLPTTRPAHQRRPFLTGQHHRIKLWTWHRRSLPSDYELPTHDTSSWTSSRPGEPVLAVRCR